MIMPKLISADKLTHALREDLNIPGREFARVKRYIEEAEDELIRCKDCVNYCGFENCKNGICDVDSVSKRAVYPDDFCSYGERRTE